MSSNTSEDKQPAGELVIRDIAMPAQTNANGDIFGGWILSQMDLGGAILAKQTAQSRVVTVAVDSMSFLSPVQVGDIISCYAVLDRIGTTSLAIAIETWVFRQVMAKHCCVTKGLFTYVATDDKGKPIPVVRP